MNREVGDLVLNTENQRMVLPPEKYCRGDQLVGNCLVSTHVCSCQDRHLSWSCNASAREGGAGGVVPGCRHLVRLQCSESAAHRHSACAYKQRTH